MHLQDDESFLTVLREGLAVGISCIVANSQASNISYKYKANFANKVALFCNETSEYSDAFDRPQIQPDDIVGRAIVEVGKKVLECQTFMAFEGEREVDRSRQISMFIERINNRENIGSAKPIPFIPNVLEKQLLNDGYRARLNGYSIPIGLSYEDVSPVYLDISSLGAIGLCGREGRGHSNIVKYILNELNNNAQIVPSEVVIIDDISRKFSGLARYDIVKKYTINPTDVIEILKRWHEELSGRYQSMIDNASYDDKLLLMIINNNDAAGSISSDLDTMDYYRDIITRYKNLNVGIIFSNYPNQNISYDAPEPIMQLKRDRHFIYFDELDNMKVIDFTYDIIQRNKRKMQKGDAFIIDDSNAFRVKLVRADE